MTEKDFFKARIYFIAVVAIAIWSLLLWNHTHGGVPCHHILADKDLPEISNWWGAIILPLLTGFLTYRIQRRIFNNHRDASVVNKQVTYALSGFAGALLFGISLSVFFTLGNEDMTGNLMLTIFPLALFLPLYRSEYLLGFVIGMTFTFGAVLPTGVGSILLLTCAILYLYVRWAFLFVISKVRGARTS